MPARGAEPLAGSLDVPKSNSPLPNGLAIPTSALAVSPEDTAAHTSNVTTLELVLRLSNAHPPLASTPSTTTHHSEPYLDIAASVLPRAALATRASHSTPTHMRAGVNNSHGRRPRPDPARYKIEEKGK